MASKEVAVKETRWSDERTLIELIAQEGPRTIEELSMAFDGEFGFGWAALSVSRLLLAGKVSMLTTGHIALSAHNGFGAGTNRASLEDGRKDGP